MWCMCVEPHCHIIETLLPHSFPSNSPPHRIKPSSRLPRDVIPQPTRPACGVEHEFSSRTNVPLRMVFQRKRTCPWLVKASILGHPAPRVNHLLAATDRPLRKGPMTVCHRVGLLGQNLCGRSSEAILRRCPFALSSAFTPIQSGPTPHALLRSSVCTWLQVNETRSSPRLGHPASLPPC